MEMRKNQGRIFALVSVLIALMGGVAHAGGDGFVLELAALHMPIEQTLANVERARALGARHFNIPVLLCQESRLANEVYWCGDDPFSGARGTQEQAAAYWKRIVALGRELRARGLSVGIFPFQLSKDQQWRGFFEPANFDEYATSYLHRLREIAVLAARIGSEDFILGSELGKLYVHPDPAQQAARSDFWRRASAEVRSILDPGSRVFVVANWDQYDAIPFWDASDFVAMSAYYPLASDASDETSVEALAARWRKWAAKLVNFAARVGKPLYFSEVGYAAVRVAAREPWSWEGELDLGLQERLFAAFAKVWGARKGPDARFAARLARFQVWALNVADDPSSDRGFSVIGKPAERALEHAFKGRARRRVNFY
jgi:hypothetical protein